MRWLKPRPLRSGDALRLIAPSGPFDREAFDRGLARVSTRYKPLVERRLFASARYLAGADSVRLEGLSQALSDPDAHGILVARGGYGAMRLLPMLSLPPGRPPLLMGFSDVTALHCLFQTHGRMAP